MIYVLFKLAAALAVLSVTSAVPQGFDWPGANGGVPPTASFTPAPPPGSSAALSDGSDPAITASSDSSGSNSTDSASASSGGDTFAGKATWYTVGGVGACGVETTDNDFNGTCLLFHLALFHLKPPSAVIAVRCASSD